MKGMQILAAGIFALSAGSAHAGTYADALSKCLASKATVADQTAFMQWFFSALSAAPEVKFMATTTDAQHAQYNREAASLISRLILEDCRSESVAVMRYEGTVAFSRSFQAFGEVAARGLMADPAVQKQLNQIDSYIDKSKFEALGKEAAQPDVRP